MKELSEEFLTTVPAGYKVVKEGEAFKAPDGHKLVKVEDYTRLAEAGNDLKKFKSGLTETFGDGYDLSEIKAKVNGYEELKGKNTDSMEKRIRSLEKTNEALTSNKTKIETDLKETKLKGLLSNRRLAKQEFSTVADEFIQYDYLKSLDLSLPPEQLEQSVDTILENALNRQNEVFNKYTGGQGGLPVQLGVGSQNRQSHSAEQEAMKADEEMVDLTQGFGARFIDALKPKGKEDSKQ